MSDGFYNFDFEHSAGGFGRRGYLLHKLIPLQLKMPLRCPCEKPCVIGAYTFDVIKLSAVGYLADDFIYNRMTGNHLFIGAN